MSTSPARKAAEARRVRRALPARFPLAPLLAAAGMPSGKALSATLGLHASTAHEWSQNGLDAYEADVAAIRIGSHPALVWGADWLDLPIAEALLEDGPARKARPVLSDAERAAVRKAAAAKAAATRAARKAAA